MATRGRKPKSWGDPMMDGAWQWAADMGAGSGLALQVSLTPSTRLEVWNVAVRALHVVDGKPAGIKAQFKTVWPDASYQSLGAAILGACSALATELLEDDLVREAAAP